MATSITLTDPIEIENFKAFCQHRQEILNEHQQWKEFRVFCKNMGFGSMTLSVEDGRPKKILNPMQVILFGIVDKTGL